MFWSDTGKTWEGFAPLWNIVRCSQDTLKDSQGHSNACAYRMYLRYLWTVTMVFQVFHGLSANVYWEEFMDTSLFLALNCPNKIHDFHLYFSLRLPYMPLHALTKLFESSGLNLFFFHLLDQATFRFKCLCFCTILHHFRRCFSCFLQTSDISSCTLQQNDVHWLEKVYISSACYFMCSASYIDMCTLRNRAASQVYEQGVLQASEPIC